ncbi:uncharacterized protein [Neodiprion pinetum]|uniref:uncharacterized protein n=1 Tax=Neodiprion pinetum TaxID=441929 RepID=UPI001EDCD35B|nr:uncharacterized protein LOC124214347 [Neodiprion pinetum]
MVNSINGFKLPPDYILVSLDVISLYTNIPLNLVTNFIKKRWSEVSPNILVPLEQFLLALNICFDAPIFKFDDKVFSQIFGLPMGSSLFPILADMITDDLEDHGTTKLPFSVPFYFRYVDDILTAVPKDYIPQLLKIFNTFHPRLQFTIEIELNNKINFLDVTIINNSYIIETDWFHKITWSERYLNFYSHHPRSYKIGTIINLVDRGIRLANSCYHEKNLKLIRDVLIKIDYPPGLLHRIINQKYKKICEQDNNNSLNPTYKENLTFISIPYVKGLFESLNRTFQEYNVQFVGENVDDLSLFFDTGKDKLPLEKQSNLVYKICCKDCNKLYIGQTSRCLNVRINEHKNNFKDSDDRYTALTKHAMSLNHQFDFDNAKILHKEPRYYNRLVLEMCNIANHSDAVNHRQDIENLSEIYIKLIKDMKA